jgi:hypothetical protein
LSDGVARLAARHPLVWHVIEADGAGPWLNETGLLPSAELLRLSRIEHDGTNRDSFRRLDLGQNRVAILRPQQMPDRWLTPTLFGTYAGRPERWRQHVDCHVFFWTEERRRDAFIRACMRFRTGPCVRPVTLAIDTQLLLARHAPVAFFAKINVGSTVRGGARVRRDENTLRPVADYRAGPVAEMAIRGSVGLRGVVRTVLDPLGVFPHTRAARHPAG